MDEPPADPGGSTPPEPPGRPGGERDGAGAVEVQSVFVRRRNVLLLRAQFTALYVDHYLHLMEHGLRYPEELDAKLKEMLAALVLHATARPWAETIAWTANLRAPRANLFAVASSLDGSVVGRLFTEGIRETPQDMLFSQTSAPDSEPRTSTVELHSARPAGWAEDYYSASEQRPCRCFDLGDENFALLAAQPDADLEWLRGLDPAAVARIDSDEETKVLETRAFRHHCGCSVERILPVLGSWRDRPDELFGAEDHITIDCPRCGARFLISRDMI